MATESQKPSDDLNPSLENQNGGLNPQPKSEDPSSASISGSDDSKITAPPPESLSVSVSDVDKKMRRAERFGISVHLTEQEKRSSRAERFGTGSGNATTSGSGSGPDSESSMNLENRKRKARAQRFGVPSPPVASEEDAKKKSRLARFAPAAKIDPLEDDKKKARGLRFASTQSISVSEPNGNGNVEPVILQTAAIAGKAGGVA